MTKKKEEVLEPESASSSDVEFEVVPVEAHARAAYAAYIKQKSVRERPRCALTFDELPIDEREAWVEAINTVIT